MKQENFPSATTKLKLKRRKNQFKIIIIFLDGAGTQYKNQIYNIREYKENHQVFEFSRQMQ